MYRNQLRHSHDAIAIKPNNFLQVVRMLASQDNTGRFSIASVHLHWHVPFHALIQRQREQVLLQLSSTVG